MSKNVTDRVILKKIYDTYYSEFCAFDTVPTRESEVYVPIDCHLIANDLGLNPSIVFGRLYYHLDKKHGYKKDDGLMVHLFTHQIGEDKHAVNFPLLSAVLAEHEQSFYRFTIPLFVSTTALLISIAAYVSSNT
ncbi:MAG: hypothetical protein ACK4L8_08010 [Nitrincola lacisaponensis]|uniref:hypothetical protein n=1 Tax=Nitrincola lacisaponensis TaxID=267850 RepID=UPI00391D0F09